MTQHQNEKRSKLSWFIAISGLLLTVFASLQVKQLNQANAIKNFSFIADQVATKIEERLTSYALVLRGSAGLFGASGEITRQEWDQYVSQLQLSQSMEGISGINFAILLTPDELEQHILDVQNEGFPDYRVWPAGKRERYSSILFLSPFSGNNLQAFGYDMYSEPVRRAAMIKAASTGNAALSGKVELKIESDTAIQAGTLMYVPIYRKNAPIENSAQRQQALIGWTHSAYRMNDLMQGMLGDWPQSEKQRIELRVYDGEITEQQLLYTNNKQPNTQPTSDFFQQRLIKFNDSQWLLTLDSLQPSLITNHTSSWVTFIAGLTLTALLFFLFRSISSTRSRALLLAQQLTEKIQQREQQVEALLNQLTTIASRIPGMVYEYRLYPDGHGCFPYASESIQHIYRIHAHQVLEDDALVLALIHPDDIAGVLYSIDVSAKTLAPWRQEYRICFKDGTQHWLFGDAQPYKEADGSISWYGIMKDITERKKTEIALKKANQQTQRFREALDHVPSCIFMKDIDDRYIYANRATLTLFNCTTHELIGSQKNRFPLVKESTQTNLVNTRVFSGEQIHNEFDILTKEGNKLTFLQVKTPIYDETEYKGIVGLLGIATDITLLKANEQKLERLAHYDPLTQLPNRVLFADRLQQAMLQAHRQQQSLMVVYLDLDGFKLINDTYGHTAGDQLLISVSARMQDVIREGDTLSRLGGDEFVAILVNVIDFEHSKPLLTRLLEAAARPMQLGKHRLQVSASLGVSLYPQTEEQEPDQLLRQADQAMYQAKLAGKNRYHLFDAEQDRSMRSHHQGLKHIRHALNAGEFVLYYQPKVNMRTGTVLGVEALIRWQHPIRGLLPPSYFLPIIEDHPLAIEVGNWVLNTALQQIRSWQQQGLNLPISVNIGARQLRQPDFVAQLKKRLQAYPDIAPDMLELEVLETSTLGDLAHISSTLEACRALGLSLSLDDFGTGYSSLTYLKRLPTNMIKVDQSFIRDILEDPEDLAILDGVLSLANAFGRQVIAEGVETLEHGNTLLRIGCDLAQGYGIARPMPAADISNWISTWQPQPHWATLRRLSRAELPLLYASIEHKAWLEEISSTLHNNNNQWPQFNIEQGYLSHWLTSQAVLAPERLAAQNQLHQQLSQLVQELQQLHHSGKSDVAINKLTELAVLQEQLFSELEECMNEHRE